MSTLREKKQKKNKKTAGTQIEEGKTRKWKRNLQNRADDPNVLSDGNEVKSTS